MRKTGKSQRSESYEPIPQYIYRDPSLDRVRENPQNNWGKTTRRQKKSPIQEESPYQMPHNAWGIFSKQSKSSGAPLDVCFGDNIYTDKNALLDFLRFPAPNQRVRIVVVAGRQSSPTEVFGNFKASYLAGPWTFFQFTSATNVNSFLEKNQKKKEFNLLQTP